MTNNPYSIRTDNTKKVLANLITKNSLSRAELSKILKINKATISEIINKLIDEGYVNETGYGESTPSGGRKPIMLQMNKSAGIICSFEFQYDEFSFMSTLIDGEVIYKLKKSILITKKNIKKIIIDTINNFKENSPKTKFGIIGIGIAIHGIVKNNNILFTPYYDIDKINIKNELENELKIPITIDNEANLFALAESTINTKYKNFIAVNISSGIGSGIIIDSLLYKGLNGKAGEIGHLTLHPNGRLCSCNNKGCFEQYCSKKALLKDYSIIKNVDNPKLSKIKFDYDKNDSEVINLLDIYTQNLEIGLKNIIKMLAPEIIILKSEIFDTFPEVYHYIENSLRKYDEDLKITLTNLGPDSTLLGAMIMSLQNHFGISSLNLYSK